MEVRKVRRWNVRESDSPHDGQLQRLVTITLEMHRRLVAHQHWGGRHGKLKQTPQSFFIYLMPLPGQDKLMCGIYRKLYCRVYLHRAEAQAGQRAYQKRLQSADLRAGRRQGKELRMRQHLQRLRDWTHTHTKVDAGEKCMTQEKSSFHRFKKKKELQQIRKCHSCNGICPPAGGFVFLYV